MKHSVAVKPVVQLSETKEAAERHIEFAPGTAGAIIADFDENGDHEVTFDEFAKSMRKNMPPDLN